MGCTVSTPAASGASGADDAFPPEKPAVSQVLPGLRVLPSTRFECEPTEAETAETLRIQMDQDMNSMINATEAKLTLIAEKEKDAVALFEKYDLDKSGRLEVKEIRGVFEELGLAISEEQFHFYVKALLREYDADNSRSVDLKEFKNFYAKCLKSEDLKELYAKKIAQQARVEKLISHAKKMFLKYDLDHSKSLDFAEMNTLLKETLSAHISFTSSDWDLLTQDVFDRGDKNNSGLIEFEEFLNIYEKCLASPSVKRKYEAKVTMRQQNGAWIVDDGL